MAKNKNQATTSKVEAKAQQGQSGIVGSENTNIKVELKEKDNSSAIVNDGLANRIAKSFKKELDYLH